MSNSIDGGDDQPDNGAKSITSYREEPARKNHNVIERRRKDKINFWIKKIAEIIPFEHPKKESKNGILERTFKYIMHLKDTNDSLMRGNADAIQFEELKSTRKRIKELEDTNCNYYKLLRIAGITPSALPSAIWDRSKQASNAIESSDDEQSSSPEDCDMKTSATVNKLNLNGTESKDKRIQSPTLVSSVKLIPAAKAKPEDSTAPILTLPANGQISANNGNMLFVNNQVIDDGLNRLALNSSQLQLTSGGFQLLPNGQLTLNNGQLKGQIILGSTMPQPTTLLLPNGQLVSVMNQSQPQFILNPTPRIVVTSGGIGDLSGSHLQNGQIVMNGINVGAQIEPIVNGKKRKNASKNEQKDDEKKKTKTKSKSESTKKKKLVDEISESTFRGEKNSVGDLLAKATETIFEINSKDSCEIQQDEKDKRMENNESMGECEKEKNEKEPNEKTEQDIITNSNENFGFVRTAGKSLEQDTELPLLLSSLSDDQDINGESVHSVSNSSLPTFLSLSPSDHLSDFLSKEAETVTRNSNQRTSDGVHGQTQQNSFVDHQDSNYNGKEREKSIDNSFDPRKMKQSTVPLSDNRQETDAAESRSTTEQGQMKNRAMLFESQTQLENQMNSAAPPSTGQSNTAQETATNQHYLAYSAESLIRQQTPNPTPVSNFPLNRNLIPTGENANNGEFYTTSNMNQRNRPGISYSAERLIHSSTISEQSQNTNQKTAQKENLTMSSDPYPPLFVSNRIESSSTNANQNGNSIQFTPILSTSLSEQSIFGSSVNQASQISHHQSQSAQVSSHHHQSHHQMASTTQNQQQNHQNHVHQQRQLIQNQRSSMKQASFTQMPPMLRPTDSNESQIQFQFMMNNEPTVSSQASTVSSTASSVSRITSADTTYIDMVPPTIGSTSSGQNNFLFSSSSGYQTFCNGKTGQTSSVNPFNYGESLNGCSSFMSGPLVETGYRASGSRENSGCVETLPVCNSTNGQMTNQLESPYLLNSSNSTGSGGNNNGQLFTGSGFPLIQSSSSTSFDQSGYMSGNCHSQNSTAMKKSSESKTTNSRQMKNASKPNSNGGGNGGKKYSSSRSQRQLDTPVSSPSSTGLRNNFPPLVSDFHLSGRRDLPVLEARMSSTAPNGGFDPSSARHESYPGLFRPGSQSNSHHSSGNRSGFTASPVATMATTTPTSSSSVNHTLVPNFNLSNIFPDINPPNLSQTANDATIKFPPPTPILGKNNPVAGNSGQSSPSIDSSLVIGHHHHHHQNHQSFYHASRHHHPHTNTTPFNPLIGTGRNT